MSFSRYSSYCGVAMLESCDCFYRHTILASREHLCINTAVRDGGGDINAKCKELIGRKGVCLLEFPLTVVTCLVIPSLEWQIIFGCFSSLNGFSLFLYLFYGIVGVDHFLNRY